jgi:hypothetical protein
MPHALKMRCVWPPCYAHICCAKRADYIPPITSFTKVRHLMQKTIEFIDAGKQALVIKLMEKS